MAGLSGVSAAVSDMNAQLQFLAMASLAVQIILSALLLGIWYIFRKEAKLPAYAFVCIVLLSLAVSPLSSIVVFIAICAFTYFKEKKLDWSRIFVLQSLVSGAIGVLISMLFLAMMVLGPSVNGALYR